MSPAFMSNIDSSQEEVTKLAEQIHSMSEDSGHLTERMILLEGKMMPLEPLGKII